MLPGTIHESICGCLAQSTMETDDEFAARVERHHAYCCHQMHDDWQRGQRWGSPLARCVEHRRGCPHIRRSYKTAVVV